MWLLCTPSCKICCPSLMCIDPQGRTPVTVIIYSHIEILLHEFIDCVNVYLVLTLLLRQ